MLGTASPLPRRERSPWAGDMVRSPACDSWGPTDQETPGVLWRPSQLSCPGSLTLPDVRQEDLYVF